MKKTGNKKNQKKFLNRVMLVALAVVCTVGALYACNVIFNHGGIDALFSFNAENVPSAVNMPGGSTSAGNGGFDEENEGILEVHFIDVGQGDSILLKCDGEAMLIDAGNNNKGTTVQHYLLKQNVARLKYIVGTHPDADHIGGLDVIITKFDITSGQVWMPEVSNDTVTYEEVMSAIFYKSYKKVCPKAGSIYQLGSASVSILGPLQSDYEDVNDSSIVIKVTYKEKDFLFTGDAEAVAEADLIANGGLEADVLKVGHHGSNSSTMQEFLDAVSPEFAVIQVGDDNKYGHPTKETLDRLSNAGIQIFRTDESGSVIAYCDGSDLSWGYFSDDEEGEITYVLNTNTQKFHLPTCSSAIHMKEKNKLEVFWNYEQCIENGFTPCTNCNPE